MFLLAKSASAATAALGFSGYLIDALDLNNALLVPLAFAAVLVLTLVVLSGLRRSNTVNITIVSVTLFTLLFFVVAGIPVILNNDVNFYNPFFVEADNPGTVIQSILHASALMFVAYTGYGRIATMGEEVREPRRVIPRAIITTLVLTMILYISVAIVGVGVVGSDGLTQAVATDAAPLEAAARTYTIGIAPQIIALGAITAMLGVLLNLILGLPRVLLAMGRRRDMPIAVSRLNSSGTTPSVAVIVMGTFIALLVLIGDVKTTWSFSAFNVLIYYAITNLAALQLKPEERLFPRWIAIVGLVFCLFLAFWVEVAIWLLGLGLIAVGLVWHWLVAPRFFRATASNA